MQLRHLSLKVCLVNLKFDVLWWFSFKRKENISKTIIILLHHVCNSRADFYFGIITNFIVFISADWAQLPFQVLNMMQYMSSKGCCLVTPSLVKTIRTCGILCLYRKFNPQKLSIW